MTTLIASPANQKQLARLRELLDQLCEETLVRDFYGTVHLELRIQDGTIQSIRRRVERIFR